MHVLVLVLCPKPIVRSLSNDCKTFSIATRKGVTILHLQWPLVLFRAFTCMPETGDGWTICTGLCCGIGACPSPRLLSRT